MTTTKFVEELERMSVRHSAGGLPLLISHNELDIVSPIYGPTLVNGEIHVYSYDMTWWDKPQTHTVDSIIHELKQLMGTQDCGDYPIKFNWDSRGVNADIIDLEYDDLDNEGVFFYIDFDGEGIL